MTINHREKTSQLNPLFRAKIVRIVFDTMEASGSPDRHLAEKIAGEVIYRLEQDRAGFIMPFPGMESLVSPMRWKDDRLTDSEIKGMVNRFLAEMGHLDISQAEEQQLPSHPAPATEKVRRVPIFKAATSGLSSNAIRVLEKRYLRKNNQGQVIETPEEMFRRIAKHIASAESLFNRDADVSIWEENFYQAMVNLEFLPNSPTLMNAGRELGQLSACFVLPVEDSMESIFDAVKFTALIHKSGGGTGFSFSHLRPENDRVGSTGGVASGPVSFIRAFDTATDVIKQGGMRRGANMAILNINHPDIMKFITAKDASSAFDNFNFSVAITEKFMEAAEQDADYDLINPHTGESAGKLNAKEVLDKIVDMAWRTGDPGVVFIDRINKDNPTPNLGAIESTNPCGEQPLLPYESCNLGSINLAKMLCEGKSGMEMDYPKLAQMVKLAVRFLDDVIEVNEFPLPQIEQMSKATRKIGLGVMGFADMLIQLGIPYDSEEALQVAGDIMDFINQEAASASAELAVERGSFPAFKGSTYDTSRGPQMRNAAQTTVAPTGTLSIIANCSSGIEPLFAVCYTRTILEGEQLVEVNQYFEEIAKREGFWSEELMQEVARNGSVRAIEEIPLQMQRLFVTAHDITPEWHVKMQAIFQKFTDNAVSKTVNFPHSATREDIAKVFMLAYKEGCKGITIYRDRSKDRQVLSISGSEKLREDRLIPRKRSSVTTGFTEKVSTGCGNMYVTVNSDEHGICEVFSTLGKAGGCASAQLEAICRLISLELRSGLDLLPVVKQLRGIRCPSIAWENGHAVLSCADAIGSVLEKQLQGGNPSRTEYLSSAGNTTGQCPECGNLLIYQEGCQYCPTCGYTRCG